MKRFPYHHGTQRAWLLLAVMMIKAKAAGKTRGFELLDMLSEEEF